MPEYRKIKAGVKRVAICLAALALALAPSTRAVSTISAWALADMAVLDSSAPESTSDPAAGTVCWEQDTTTVGRVMLQTNGFESCAILCMPKELRVLDPDRIQKTEGHFEAHINTWSGERITMHPVTSPTRLEMAGNRPLNGANPDHGPSWKWADGPVETNDLAYPRLAWNTPGGDILNRCVTSTPSAGTTGCYLDLAPASSPAAFFLLSPASP